MLQLYIGKNGQKLLEDKGIYIWYDMEELFSQQLLLNPEVRPLLFTENCKRILKEIENANYNEYDGTYTTPFGSHCTTEDFSAGTKTLLCIVLNLIPKSNQAHCLNEVGANIWDYLFKHYGHLNRVIYAKCFEATTIPKEHILLNEIEYEDFMKFRRMAWGELH